MRANIQMHQQHTGIAHTTLQAISSITTCGTGKPYIQSTTIWLSSIIHPSPYGLAVYVSCFKHLFHMHA